MLTPRSPLWLKLSHKLDRLLCIDTTTLTVENNELKFAQSKFKWAHFVRFLCLECLFILPIIPKLQNFIAFTNILRSVYVYCTISLHLLILVNFRNACKHRILITTSYNRLTGLWNDLKSHDTFYQTLLQSKIYFWEMIFLFVVGIVLLQQDGQRGFKWNEMLAYTCTEIMVLKIILHNTRPLIYFVVVQKRLNAQIKNCKIQDVTRFVKLQQRLTKVCRNINYGNRLFFSIITTNSFSWILFNLYKFIYLITYSDENELIVNYYMSLTWCFTQIFHISFIVYVCERTIKGYSMFKGKIVDCFSNLRPGHKQRFKLTIYQCSLCLFDHRMKFDANYLFEIDCGLLLTISATVSTYLTVLYNFEIMNEIKH